MRLQNDGGNWKCTGITDSTDIEGAPPTAGMASRLPVTGADLLTGRGIDIAIAEGLTRWATHDGASHNEIGVAALCIGLGFDVWRQDGSGKMAKVYFYLDDP